MCISLHNYDRTAPSWRKANGGALTCICSRESVNKWVHICTIKTITNTWLHQWCTVQWWCTALCINRYQNCNFGRRLLICTPEPYQGPLKGTSDRHGQQWYISYIHCGQWILWGRCPPPSSLNLSHTVNISSCSLTVTPHRHSALVIIEC